MIYFDAFLKKFTYIIWTCHNDSLFRHLDIMSAGWKFVLQGIEFKKEKDIIDTAFQILTFLISLSI
jgi:hypothetical protein